MLHQIQVAINERMGGSYWMFRVVMKKLGNEIIAYGSGPHCIKMVYILLRGLHYSCHINKRV